MRELAVAGALAAACYCVFSTSFTSEKVLNEKKKKEHLLLIGPGTPDEFDCSRLNGLSLDCEYLSLDSFDSNYFSETPQIGLNLAMKELSKSFEENGIPKLVISCSRGVNVLMEAVRIGLWDGQSLMLSPILVSDDYAKLINEFESKAPNYHIATGESSDEIIIIKEPVEEAFGNLQLERAEEQRKLSSLEGDHEWYAQVGSRDKFLKMLEEKINASEE